MGGEMRPLMDIRCNSQAVSAYVCIAVRPAITASTISFVWKNRPGLTGGEKWHVG